MKIEITKDVNDAINKIINYDYKDEFKDLWAYVDGDSKEYYDKKLAVYFGQFAKDEISPETLLLKFRLSPKYKQIQKHIFYSILVTQVFLEFYKKEKSRKYGTRRGKNYTTDYLEQHMR